jgi:hypothetical protein
VGHRQVSEDPDVTLGLGLDNAVTNFSVLSVMKGDSRVSEESWKASEVLDRPASLLGVDFLFFLLPLFF